MAFDGNGTYTPVSPPYPAVDGTVIYAADYNTILQDLATALTLCLTKDGQQTVIANLPMNGFKFTGLAAGGLAQDSLRYDQVFTAGTSFPTPKSTISPADGDNSLYLATTAWVQTRITEPIYAVDIIPNSDYTQRLATTKYVTDKAVTPVQLPTVNLTMFYNFS